jgi:hypothetical protein
MRAGYMLLQQVAWLLLLLYRISQLEAPQVTLRNVEHDGNCTL